MQRSSSCLFLLWAIVNPRQSDTHGFISSNLMNKNRFINDDDDINMLIYVI